MTSGHRLARGRPVLALLAGLLLAAACGSTGGASGGSAGKSLHVALVVNGTLGDKGFFDSANSGVERMHSQLGAQTKVLQASPTNPAEWLQNLQAVSGQNYNIVITGSSQMTDNVKKVAAADPQQKFIFFDDIVNLPNVASIRYEQNQGSFLAGVLAAIVTTNTKDFHLSKGHKTVGIVGGINIPVINDFVVGYEKGVQSVDPGIKVLTSYVGSFADPQTGYNQATAMYQSGADIVYAVAGGSGLGVLKASQAANSYSIGVDSNQNGLYPGHVLASMVKRVDNSTFDLAKEYQNGKLKFGQTYVYGLPNHGVDLIIDTKDVPASVVDQVNGLRAQVAAGKIQVPTTYANG